MLILLLTSFHQQSKKITDGINLRWTQNNEEILKFFQNIAQEGFQGRSYLECITKTSAELLEYLSAVNMGSF